MTTEDYYQRYNGVLTDYAFMGGIKEFWGEAVAYYYALFIKKDITYSYVKYPDDLKPLVFPAFEFAQEKLVEKVLKENNDDVYIKKKNTLA